MDIGSSRYRWISQKQLQFEEEFEFAAVTTFNKYK